MNASSICVLVSRIAYDDEMTASSKGSDCLKQLLQQWDLDLDLDQNLDHLSEE